MIQCLRSLPTPGAVGELVGNLYGIEVKDCVLVRTFVNDVYEVIADDGRRYVLKIYQQGGWSTDEVAWEQDLVSHVAECGVAVAASVPLIDGRPAGELLAPEGNRPFAMSIRVDGDKPQPPWSDGLYLEFGRLIAGFHKAADSFRSTRPRRDFDLQITLEKPLMDNVHLTEKGMVLHDFDRAGNGWRAADLTGVFTDPRSSAHWDAFLAGYTAVRELKADDVRAIPLLAIVELISNLAFLIVEQPAFRGSETVAGELIERELNSLKDLADKV
ncbi:phosphotransferase enzyme family protein [Actinopolymorpha alba]|uniref:phosphotransferase enzyme family protein n=1 Tax=Actinopolymorpha alba TaxID=533267 RepID=UPI0003627593|nr:phosphotransferase [Actinopolymorpha alba]